MLILSAQQALSGKRRQFQLGPSYFKADKNDRGFWLREDYRVLARNGEKDDRIKWYGPFLVREWADVGFKQEEH